MFEFYGGNDTHMRTDQDFENKLDDQMADINFRDELKKINKHTKDNYVVYPKPNTPNPDSE